MVRRKQPVSQKPRLNPDAESYPVQVDDPYERGAKIVASRRMSDFISREHAAGRIDDAQKAAADLFYRYRAITLGILGQEPAWTRVQVDNSRQDYSITEAKQKAHYRLRTARHTIGSHAFIAIDQCVTQGLTPTQIEHDTGQDRKATAVYIKDGLDMLAILWGLASCPKKVRRWSPIVRLATDDFGLAVLDLDNGPQIS